MKKILLIVLAIFAFNFVNAQAKQDTTKPVEKVIFPIGEVSDTILVDAVVAILNQPLICKEYKVINSYYVFAKETNRPPQIFKQRAIDSTGKEVEDFQQRTIWANQKKKK